LNQHIEEGGTFLKRLPSFSKFRPAKKIDFCPLKGPIFMIFIQGLSIKCFFFERRDLNVGLRESHEIDLLFVRPWNGVRVLI